MPNTPALELRDVSKRYGSHWAIARLNYTLPVGRSLLLTGENGAGKTTLLRMMATAAFPTAGEVLLFGQSTRHHYAQLRTHIGLLSPQTFLYENLTAFQNLSLAAQLAGLRNATAKVNSLLERMGLTAQAKNHVRQFSTGMRKRLAIARLFIKTPKLALLDEPFTGLDEAGTARMEELILELQASSTTVVMATHLTKRGQALTQERLHLAHGRSAP